MATSKTYAYTRKTTAKIKIVIDEKALFVDFTGGFISDDKKEPAKFRTSDDKIQEQIEARADFKSGDIFIVKEKSKEATTVPAPKVDQVEGITSVPQAADYLIENHGAESSEVSKKADIKKFAASKGIEFTDLK
jgi:hypothetical protein